MKTSLTMISAGLMMGFFATGAHAVATLCSSYSPGSHPDGIAVTDMTFIGAGSAAPGYADDCYGIVAVQGGNNDTAGNIWPTGTWLSLAKDETPGGTDTATGDVLGIRFTLDADPETGANTGTWSLSWTAVGLPGYDLTMDIVGVLKAGNDFASYLFNDLFFTANDSGTGAFSIKFSPNTQGISPALSHLSLYYKDAVHSSSGGSSTGGSSTTSGGQSTSGGQIPEPTMVSLLGIGLLGQALLLRQRRRRLQK